MMHRIPGSLLLLSLAVASPAIQAEKLVREFSGSRSIYTADFTVQDPWLIDWRVSSPNPRSMSISITLIDARTDAHAGQVVQSMREGDGLRLMNQSGVFRFRIDSDETEWTIRVLQLNRDEARIYTPKR